MRNKKGFTLIELLAVIVIIAIIALIGIPSVTNIITNSRKDSLKATGLAMANAARNALAANNWTVPTTGSCQIPWNDLGMESSQMPSGGAVEPTASRVQVSVVNSNNVYTIFLANAAANATHGINGRTTAELNNTTDSNLGRNLAIIGGNFSPGTNATAWATVKHCDGTSTNATTID